MNNAIEAVQNIQENKGKLGVFWHTQGSGKSYSMQFFSQKVLRTLPGNWTFLIITDREDLDDQIYKNFAKTSAVTEPEKSVRAKSGEHLKQLLTEDHRYVFTLIQKFRSPKGEDYPHLSDRSDIIVIADEAHRSQYDTFAGNLRKALPNAGFIGFTGTPLLVGEEKTREEFGDYISIYNFRESVEDGATIPLFYENRIPELELTNTALDDDITEAIEAADLNEEEEDKLAREFGREYNLITREERLDAIAQDIVTHYLGRGQQGKAMIISIDRLAKANPGLDEQFKDPENPLRIVFVCAMWITGFDAPSCSTIYLDKFMRNHTLMQTIARANRVFEDKINGLIVDYIGVFRNLQKALAIYGSASGGDVQEGDLPVQPKGELVEELREAIAQMQRFCQDKGINLEAFGTVTSSFARTKLWDDAVEAILVNEESKQEYLSLSRFLSRLYKAILPDPSAFEFRNTLYIFNDLHKRQFTQDLNREDKRVIAQNLSEEELAVFDLLTQPDPPLQTRKSKRLRRQRRSYFI